MPPVRKQPGKRPEHEFALLHARMRQDGICLTDSVADADKINIDHPVGITAVGSAVSAIRINQALGLGSDLQQTARGKIAGIDIDTDIDETVWRIEAPGIGKHRSRHSGSGSDGMFKQGHRPADCGKAVAKIGSYVEMSCCQDGY